ncbi:hypothetical protein [Paludibacterium sp.]|uniref:hypothetical protein n=1 Tax=Paludibacterium sp. TaxID=1917523 RepID=UPI0025EB8BC1|nr:hypothetical protein [Paludibacterium sp.]MBV8649705.1 hypothetical protein [Paludibacterium sp.]
MSKIGRPSVRQAVFDALPGTIKQVAKKSGASGGSTRYWLKQMHIAGEIHIGGWRRSQGAKQMVYHAGPGNDKPEPRTFTQAEMLARFEKKHPGRHRDIKNASARRAYRREKLDAKGCGWMAALFHQNNVKTQESP